MTFPPQHLQILDRVHILIIMHVKGIVLVVDVLIMYTTSTNAIEHGGLTFRVNLQTPFPI